MSLKITKDRDRISRAQGWQDAPLTEHF